MQKSSIHSNLIHLEPNSNPHPTSRIEFSRGKRSRPTELADNPFKNSHRSLVLVLLHRRLFISPSFEESCGQTFHDVFVAHAREPHSIVKTKGLRETFTKSRNVSAFIKPPVFGSYPHRRTRKRDKGVEKSFPTSSYYASASRRILKENRLRQGSSAISLRMKRVI